MLLSCGNPHRGVSGNVREAEPGQTTLPQVRPAEICVFDVSACQVALAKFSIDETRLAQVRVHEIAFSPLTACQVEARENSVGQAATLENGLVEELRTDPVMEGGRLENDSAHHAIAEHYFKCVASQQCRKRKVALVEADPDDVAKSKFGTGRLICIKEGASQENAVAQLRPDELAFKKSAIFPSAA